jgi:thymidylate kinase
VKTVPVIAFFGPDGAGKSTQVALLIDYLKRKNLKTRRAWIRAVHSLAFVLSKVLIRMGYVKTAPAGAPGMRRLDLGGSPALQMIWPWVELASMLPLILIRVKIPSLLGRMVVCERYTLDSIPSISYTLDDEHFDQHVVGRVLLSMVSPEYVLINLDCDYPAIVKRRGEFAEPEDFIRVQRDVYSKFTKSMKALYLNTASRTTADTQTAIRMYVESKLLTKP